MKIVYWTIPFILLIPALVFGQNRGDSLLRNERSIDRPVIVHHGQLRISAGYNFATLRSRFDEDGDKIKLADQGTVSVQHSTFLDLKYGYGEFLQLNIAANFKSRNERTQPVRVSNPVNSVEISEIRQFTGMEDLFVGAEVLLPWNLPRIGYSFFRWRHITYGLI